MADHRRMRDSRSRSPQRHDSHRQRRRSRSPHRHQHRERKRTTEVEQPPRELPYGSRQLSKKDFDAFKPMLALYLDIQKGKILEELDDVEVRGRWKSFLGKWNRGELSEGWYDPTTYQKTVQTAWSESRAPENPQHTSQPPTKDSTDPTRRQRGGGQDTSESDSDDSIGPTLPGVKGSSRSRKMGPSIPNMDDLELKREMEAEDGLSRRDDMRFARKMDRKQQKESLDDLVPRAEAGTRERQFEKKKEVNEKMKSFREKSPGAVEVPDTELMGGGDGIDSYKKQKESFERKKNERELRRDEFLRARQAEREERMQEYRSKEEGTMAMLKALAKQNFG